MIPLLGIALNAFAADPSCTGSDYTFTAKAGGGLKCVNRQETLATPIAAASYDSYTSVSCSCCGLETDTSPQYAGDPKVCKQNAAASNAQAITYTFNATTGHCVDSASHAVACSYCGKLNGCLAPKEPGPVPTATPWAANYHSCSRGSGNAIPASPVSSKITGNPLDGSRFDNTVNKRLACCLSSANGKFPNYDSAWGAPPDGKNSDGSFFEKYDCVENVVNSSGNAYANFNELWASSSGNANDLLPNAVILRNSLGNPITGFYNSTGGRCNEFSEVSLSALVTGKVNPIVVKDIQMNKVEVVGVQTDQMIFDSTGFPTIPVPSTALWNSLYVGKPKMNGPPDCRARPADCLRCRYLVRAAMVAKCPPNSSAATAPIRTYTENPPQVMGVTPPPVYHCAVASNVQIHVRVEQVYQVPGTPTMVPVDTIVESGRAAAIDVGKLIHP